MQCDRARDLLGASVDGEVTGAERQAIAEHVRSCPRCAAEAEDIRRLSRQVAAVGREAAPRALARRISADLAAEHPVATDAVAIAPAVRMQSNRQRYGSMAASLAAACLVTAALTWSVANRWTASERFERDIVSAHIRSLLQDAPIQVASSDAHTVKPWFMGRIDFAPDIKDLTAEGFPLAGGRLDYIGERRVGAIVYRRHKHVVNVFMWPAEQAAPIAAQAVVHKGYNLLSWSKGGLTYWAISDLNDGEMRQLQGLL